MTNMINRTIILCFLLVFGISTCLAKPLQIEFWHSMSGELGIALNQIVKEFNRSQEQYEIVPIYKGNYPEALTSLVAAFRAGEQPAIAQVFEVGTATMIYPSGAIIPVYQVMRDTHTVFSTYDYLPAIASYYSNKHGQLLALPFNSSTPVMFINADAFVKAGINPRKPPLTWPALHEAAVKLLAHGYHCGFTTSWPSWIQLEAFSAWHNQQFASDENGFSGLNAKLLINQNSVILHHLETLTAWQKQKIFVYGGREDNAMSLFTSGECPMLFESSGSSGDLVNDSPFKVIVAPIPYWPNVKGAPQNMLIGGAALWVMSGKSKPVYQGVAQFFKFLAKPEIQLQWMRASGYLPVTWSAYRLAKMRGYYQKNPGAWVALQELLAKKPSIYSKGIRLGDYNQIRVILDESLEAMFSQHVTVQQALDNAVDHSNHLLKRFQQNVS